MYRCPQLVCKITKYIDTINKVLIIIIIIITVM